MGVLLLVVGLVALAFGFVQQLKARRILAAPFQKTGDIVADPISKDPRGMMSTQGTVVPPKVQVLSGLSKTPCLYYEVVITRRWEKQERTQNGYKTVKGSSTVQTIRDGALFGLDDGSGAVGVDASKGGDFDNLKKQAEAGGVFLSDGYLKFGELRIPTPPSSVGEYTLGFEAVERIVPVGGSLFVLGKLQNGKLTKPGWRSMMFSTKGRDGLLASTATKRKFSLIGGGVGAVVAVPLIIFAPAAPATRASSCSGILSGAQASCDDKVTSPTGTTYAWNVEKAGAFSFEVMPATHKKIPLDPQIVVKDAAGDVVVDEVAAGAGQSVVAKSVRLKEGAYTVIVKDVGGDTVAGGFDYQLAIRSEVVAEEVPTKNMLEDSKPVAEKKVAMAPKGKAAKPVAKKK